MVKNVYLGKEAIFLYLHLSKLDGYFDVWSQIILAKRGMTYILLKIVQLCARHQIARDSPPDQDFFLPFPLEQRVKTATYT